ncbi:unnamed protein product [Menidia menidia]|uniref:(Atlantic silverside) hypothetical protein n=1 Tax=Menidia menidia TaxID=238744 RepID=A0A8S4AVK3_9TELE|nr:unnamed protein product [Menidia menidia]
MSNQSTEATDRSTTRSYLLISTISAAQEELSTSESSSSVLNRIAANDITSTANYVYSFLAVLGLVAGCFLLHSFVQTYRAQRRVAFLDCLLWAFCGVQLLLLLLSLHSAAHRPGFLKSTAAGCAALSFAVNAASLCALLVLVLIAYVLTLDPPSHALLRRPGVCAALVVLTATLASLLLAGLRGPREGLQSVEDCAMDPARAGVSYAAARLCVICLIPYALQTGLLTAGCVRQWRSKGRFLSGSEEGPVFLAVTTLVFFCQLFYGVALIAGARIVAGRSPSPREQAFLNVAEGVLFTGSAGSLLLVLLVHRPCRESLTGVLRQLRDCCRRPGGAQPNRNIIAPHIEITDTLQDIES